MPQAITNHRNILDALERIALISELTSKREGSYKYELDLEVMVYGRNYTGKKVGPYLRLLEYDAGEEVIREGDWGNSFYIAVDGRLDAYVADESGHKNLVGAISPGGSFGEIVLMTGVPRNSTVVVPPGEKARVFEVSRPALRLLRKLETFGDKLDATYREHVLGRTLQEMGHANENLQRLSRASRLMIYGKQHVLIQEGDPINSVMLIANGWLRRVRRLEGHSGDDLPAGSGWNQHVDFLGEGHWLGLEGVPGEARWGYTATVMQRMEVMEISLAEVRADTRLRDALRQTLHRLAPAYDEVKPVSSAADQRSMDAVEKEILTGIVDATNLLVMDMDLCVRCGNCSFACHQVHGQSRLMRRHGIFIERPISLRGASGKRVLTPEVCMHCQDPACLTGCPTGAIARFDQGQIEIDPKTCIGCGDCATQCPYHAITLVPRRRPMPEVRSFGQRLLTLFDLRRAAPPPAVSQVDDLVAINCNLCHNTTLNPPGATSHAYSCQENCPTGALVRVNPREYFTEAKNRINLVYRDQTHAIGRNLHQGDPVARVLNFSGIVTIVALTCAVVWLLLRYGLDTPHGSVWLTMRWMTGLAGLVSVCVAGAYAARRKIYRRRAGPLRYWMQIHVYAGIFAGIVLLLHAGSMPGGALTSLLTISLYLTLLSGLFGVACYRICPRVLTDLEGEPLLLEELRARYKELREKLTEINRRGTPELEASIRVLVYKRFFSLSFLLRQYLRREELSALMAAARGETATELDPSLDQQARYLVLEAVETAVTLRRVVALIYIHQLLKLWLLPHVWAAVLTVALMSVHIAQAVYSAAR